MPLSPQPSHLAPLPCLFDTHAHLTDKAFDRDREAVITRAFENGVGYVLCVGYDLVTSRSSVELAACKAGSLAVRKANSPGQPTDREPLVIAAAVGPTQPTDREPLQIYAAVGIHPHDADSFSDSSLSELKKLSRHPKVKAIGETGLDFYRNYSKPENQTRAFELQIRLARELGLPLVIHIRNAHRAAMETLKKEGYFSGVMHCFSGDQEFAREALDLGFFLSFSGTITFNIQKLKSIIETAPLDRLLIETDCPYLTPRPERGKRNEPGFVRYVLDEMAKLRRLPAEHLARTFTDNGKRCFAID